MADKQLICYVCGHDEFDVDYSVTAMVNVSDDNKPIITFPSSPRVDSILCKKCGVLQFCSARVNDPWFIGQISLKWDDEKKELVYPPKEKIIMRGGSRVGKSILSGLSQEEKELLKAMLMGGDK